MSLSPIVFAIPVFLALIGLELLVLKGRSWMARTPRAPAYHFGTAISDISCGIGNQVTGVLTFGALLLVYAWSHARVAFFDWAALPGWLQWTLGLLLVDFAYYWFHRASHRVNLFWAAHVVHHQSEDYNLAVALRQAWFQRFVAELFYLPLAFLGVPVVVFAGCRAINTLYQFWIHTELVGRMGPLEWVLNTPSHHRVHHGKNARYLDKNHGGMLIVWDRLFGTFEAEREDEPVVYGTVARLTRWDPIGANFDYFSVLKAQNPEGMVGWARVLLAPPEWSPRGRKPVPDVDRATYEKFARPVGAGRAAYVLAQHALLTPSLVGLLVWKAEEPGAALVLPALWVLASTWTLVGLLEPRACADGSGRSRRAAGWEAIRVSLAPAVALTTPLPWQAAVALTGWALFSVAALGLLGRSRGGPDQRGAPNRRATRASSSDERGRVPG